MTTRKLGTQSPGTIRLTVRALKVKIANFSEEYKGNLERVAECLNSGGIATRSGKGQWTPKKVQSFLRSMEDSSRLDTLPEEIEVQLPPAQPGEKTYLPARQLVAYVQKLLNEYAGDLNQVAAHLNRENIAPDTDTRLWTKRELQAFIIEIGAIAEWYKEIDTRNLSGQSTIPTPTHYGGQHSQPSETGETRKDAPTASTGTAETKLLSETCEPCDKRTGEPHHESRDDHLRKLIKEELEGMLGTSLLVKATPPPIPKVKGTKRYQGERVTLPGTRVDRVLADAFEQERVKAGVSASEFMQRILWQTFGKPRLSFEETRDE